MSCIGNLVLQFFSESLYTNAQRPCSLWLCVQFCVSTSLSSAMMHWRDALVHSENVRHVNVVVNCMGLFDSYGEFSRPYAAVRERFRNDNTVEYCLIFK